MSNTSLYRKRAASPTAHLPATKTESRGLCAVYGYVLHADNTRLPESFVLRHDKKGALLADFLAEARRLYAPANTTEIEIHKLDRTCAIVSFTTNDPTSFSPQNKSVAEFLCKGIVIRGTALLCKRVVHGADDERIELLPVLATPAKYIHLLEEEAGDAARTKIQEQVTAAFGDAVRAVTSSE